MKHIKNKKCDFCGKEFQVREESGPKYKGKDIRQRNFHTCSKECSHKYRVIYARAAGRAKHTAQKKCKLLESENKELKNKIKALMKKRW